jgi:methyl-accepting chemotaxis protein
MSIGKKLTLSFSVLILLLAVSIGLAIFDLNKIHQQVEEALDHRLSQLVYIADIRYEGGMQSNHIRAVILDPETTVHRENLELAAKNLDNSLVELGRDLPSNEFRGYWESANTANQEINEAITEVLATVDAGNIREATEIANTRIQEINTRMFQAAEDMLTFQTKRMDAINKETEKTVSNSMIISIIIFIISLGVGIGLIVYVRRVITMPLLRVIHIAQEFGEGNLATEDIQVSSKDEVGQLGKIFNESKHNVRRLIVSIQQSAEILSSSSEELSASAEEVLATTEEVAHQASKTTDIAQNSASAANESSLAMDETAQGIQRIAEATQVLFDSSNATNELATNGTTVVNLARQQMTNISESTGSVNDLIQKLAKETEEIENIVRIITNLTDQTNLLALNATIEAARAGEQGKGFLVVADEVRKLAEESKQSATSITKLTTEIKNDTKTVAKAMESTLPAVEKGVEVITDAGNSFEAIVGAVHEMTNQIQDISTTSEELSASAEQVSASVAEIATGSEETSTNIEAIAVSMNEQSETINDVATVSMSLSQTAQGLQEEACKFKV